MSAQVMRPQMPYDVDFTVEYRVLRRVKRLHETVWCLVIQTDRLDTALDYYHGNMPDARLERAVWVPAPELPQEVVAPGNNGSRGACTPPPAGPRHSPGQADPS